MAMDRKDIITLPDESLRSKSTKVSSFDEKLLNLVKGMEAATLDWEDHREHELGVALAAVQVNKLQKVVIIRNDFENKDDRTFLTLVNPKIIRTEGEQSLDYEGCLSVPDLYGLVPRFEKVKIKAQRLNGEEFRLVADGFLARVLQHEIDHTHGIMFIDHIKEQREAFYRLDDDGKLQSIEYEEVQSNHLLWQ